MQQAAWDLKVCPQENICSNKPTPPNLSQKFDQSENKDSNIWIYGAIIIQATPVTQSSDNRL